MTAEKLAAQFATLFGQIAGETVRVGGSEIEARGIVRAICETPVGRDRIVEAHGALVQRGFKLGSVRAHRNHVVCFTVTA